MPARGVVLALGVVLPLDAVILEDPRGSPRGGVVGGVGGDMGSCTAGTKVAGPRVGVGDLAGGMTRHPGVW